MKDTAAAVPSTCRSEREQGGFSFLLFPKTLIKHISGLNFRVFFIAFYAMLSSFFETNFKQDRTTHLTQKRSLSFFIRSYWND